MTASIDVFKAAVDALHATGDPSASQYLVAFADDPSAPQLCEVLITDASASPAQQTFAAGIIARAAANLPPNQTVEPLLKLTSSPTTCSQAVASLANALAAAAINIPDQLLDSGGFGALPPNRQLIILQSLAESLAQRSSVEELRANSAVSKACERAVHALQQAIVQPSDAIDIHAALRCLVAWAECGVDYLQLRSGFPALGSVLISALDPTNIAIGPTGLPLLQQPSLCAAVLRACLTSSREADEEVTLDACAPLLSLATKWIGGGQPSWASIASLGAPIVDPTTGLTDGGGPDSDVRNELACGLCAICGLMLELTAEEVDDALVSADAAAPSALLLRDALTLLLNCSAHALPAPAELAAEAWICLLEALPQCIPSHPDARWRNELFTIVVQRTATRCSRTHLTTSGSGEDLDDLVEWRERCGAPLLSACSETLGVSHYLGPLAQELSKALSTPSSLEGIEALLFACACVSGGGPNAPRGLSNSADAEVVRAAEQLAGKAAAAATTVLPNELASAVVEQATACRAAIDRATSDDADFEPRAGLGWASMS